MCGIVGIVARDAPVPEELLEKATRSLAHRGPDDHGTVILRATLPEPLEVGLGNERCLEQFRGMFAFALWDARRQRVLVARDPMGIKPLYYHASERYFLFASECARSWELASSSGKSIPLHCRITWHSARCTSPTH